MRACGNQQLIIGDRISLIQQYLPCFPVKADSFPPFHPFYIVEFLKVLFYKSKSFYISFSCQIFMENASGVDILILGNQDDLSLFISFSKLPYCIHTSGGRSNHYIFHRRTSSNVIACMGHFSTHMGLAVLPSELR